MISNLNGNLWNLKSKKKFNLIAIILELFRFWMKYTNFKKKNQLKESSFFVVGLDGIIIIIKFHIPELVLNIWLSEHYGFELEIKITQIVV